MAFNKKKSPRINIIYLTESPELQIDPRNDAAVDEFDDCNENISDRPPDVVFGHFIVFHVGKESCQGGDAHSTAGDQNFPRKTPLPEQNLLDLVQIVYQLDEMPLSDKQFEADGADLSDDDDFGENGEHDVDLHGVSETQIGGDDRCVPGGAVERLAHRQQHAHGAEDQRRPVLGGAAVGADRHRHHAAELAQSVDESEAHCLIGLFGTLSPPCVCVFSVNVWGASSKGVFAAVKSDAVSNLLISLRYKCVIVFNLCSVRLCLSCMSNCCLFLTASGRFLCRTYYNFMNHYFLVAINNI